ncbi:hypothetical protein D9758_015237 [Tetrapyrgos nigripes]|uniref:Glycoside hydrolase family 71 protein n=1 Tax=Tetrapyrgos nigripes TaxID=182062 RepID=A0A8H5FEP0_9AGAR|nr:hypothetical protein D9758_015237 [Tetrapyrgos nigripes]
MFLFLFLLFTLSYALPVPLTTELISKYVVAHHMVGNTFPYTIQDWLDDISLASKYNIDGFALNIGIDPWQPDRVADAYQAALQSGLDFILGYVLPSLCFSYRRTSFTLPRSQIRWSSQSIEVFKSLSGSISTRINLSGGGVGKITFVPSFFMEPNSFNEFVDGGVIDGDFNWNGAWSVDLTTASQ